MAEKSRKVQKQVGQWAVKGRGDGGEAIPGSAQQRATPPQTPQTFRATPPLPDSPFPDPGSREVRKGRLPSILKGLRALGLERRRVPVGQGMRGGHAGEVVGERGMVWASAMRSRVLGSHAPRRSEGGRGRGTGCRVSVGLPEAARFAAPGRRLLTQALPPASLPAPSQTQARIPISTPTSANGGCTPRLGPASATQPSASQLQGGSAQLTPVRHRKWHSSPHPLQPSPELEGRLSTAHGAAPQHHHWSHLRLLTPNSGLDINPHLGPPPPVRSPPL